MARSQHHLWLPTSAKEVKQRNWDGLDVIFFSGDAYVDHPSFGPAVIARLLEYLGLKVAVVPQPNWRDDLRDFKKLGKPRLFFAVSAGNMDSMINHYTANRRLRSDDAFTPGGRAGARPDYAATVYSRILKQIYPEVPVILGGIEASLRRLAHYDYWSDSFKPSILMDSGADLLVYGMGEKPVIEIVKRLTSGEPVASLKDIPQTAFLVNKKEYREQPGSLILQSYESCKIKKQNHAGNFKIIEEESNKIHAARIVEPYTDAFVVVNPPYSDYSQEDIDMPYSFSYTRMPHPRYEGKGPIPAYDMIRDSVNIHRGCFGGCSFCTISAHQGKQILSRSEKSVLEEVKNVTETPGFHGNLSDLGGPSANMYRMEGKDKKICEKCKRPSCIFPSVCKNLQASHQPLIDLYQKVLHIPGIKNVFIGSGIRYDLFYGLNNPDFEKQAKEYFRRLVVKHVSGRLKVAPEHNAPHVLKLMRKPSFDMFLHLKADFEAICRNAGLRQQVVPYLISSHPGSTPADMAGLAVELRRIGIYPEQVQDFTPTPMTLSSVIYYTGMDPYSMKPVNSARTPEDKKVQQKFFFYYKPENRNEIRRNLLKMNRPDLIKRLFRP